MSLGWGGTHFVTSRLVGKQASEEGTLRWLHNAGICIMPKMTRAIREASDELREAALCRSAVPAVHHAAMSLLAQIVMALSFPALICTSFRSEVGQGSGPRAITEGVILLLLLVLRCVGGTVSKLYGCDSCRHTQIKVRLRT